MKDLYFSLLHMRRGNPDAYTYIRDIMIMDPTSGTHVAMGTKLLARMSARTSPQHHLQNLTIALCQACYELRCDPRKWRAWKELRGFNNTQVVVGTSLDNRMCVTCTTRHPNALAANVGYGSLQRRVERRTALYNSLRRP